MNGLAKPEMTIASMARKAVRTSLLFKSRMDGALQKIIFTLSAWELFSQ